MKYFLGIDQGGTKTAALVCDLNGKILGVGYDHGLAAVYFDDTEELYIKRIVSAAKTACSMSGIALVDISAVCGGINGADWPHEHPILTKQITQGLGITNMTVLNDCIPAMRAGSSKKEVAVVCAGSGLNIAVQRADGRQIIYGYYISDAHQGGGALGAMALRKVMEATIGICGQTKLTEMILGYTGYNSAEELLIALTSGKYKLKTKTLTPLLLKAFISGDKEAVAIVDKFAEEIAPYVIAGMGRLGMNGSLTDIVFSGSVFKDIGTLVADKIFSCIAAVEPNVCKVHARYEPVCGAVLTLLDREYGGTYTDKLTAVFDESAVKHGLLRNLEVRNDN